MHQKFNNLHSFCILFVSENIFAHRNSEKAFSSME